MKRILLVISSASLLLLALAASATAKSTDAPAPKPKKSACDSSWKRLVIPGPEQKNLIGLVKPFGRTLVGRNGTVYIIYVPAYEDADLAFYYWRPGGVGALKKAALGYLTGSVGTYISAMSVVRGRILVMGKYVTLPGPNAPDDHPHPLLFEWNGRQLKNVTPTGLGEGELYGSGGDWVVGSLFTGYGQRLPLALQYKGEAWERLVVPGDLAPRSSSGLAPRWWSFRAVKVLGENKVLFEGGSEWGRFALQWDESVFTRVEPVPLERKPKAVTPAESPLAPAKAVLKRLTGDTVPELTEIYQSGRWVVFTGSGKKGWFVLRKKIC